LLNEVIDVMGSGSVDTQAELANLARIVQGIMDTANGVTPSPALTATDLALLGLTGVNEDNLNAILAAIAATANNGSEVDSLSELQAIVSAANQSYTQAVTALSNYSGSAPVPTTDTWNVAGVEGITSGNLSVANAYLAALGTSASNSTSELQALADAVTALLAGADATDNNNLSLTASQYQTLGATSIDSAAQVSLLNDVIDIQSATGVDTPGELADLAQTVSGVIDTAAGRTPNPALSVSSLSALGIPNLTADNLAAVLAAIAASADDGSGVNTLAELQTLIANAISAYNSAVSTIGAFRHQRRRQQQPGRRQQRHRRFAHRRHRCGSGNPGRGRCLHARARRSRRQRHHHARSEHR
jgi:hypothetical protein